LARRYPLTGRRPVSRHVHFRLEDALLRFWFRFIYRNTSYILQQGPARALQDLIRPDLDSYFGSCFERLCREAMTRLYERERVATPFEIGEYWDKTTQIDWLACEMMGGSTWANRWRKTARVARMLAGTASRIFSNEVP
jgi:hypothetical protein